MKTPYIIQYLWECRFQLWIIAALLMLLLMSSPASALTENFQNGYTGWTLHTPSSYGSCQWTTYTYSDTWGVSMSPGVGDEGYVQYATPIASNSWGVTSVSFTTVYGHGPVIKLLDSGGGLIYTCELPNTGSTPTRFNLKRESQVLYYSQNGGAWVSLGTCGATQPYYIRFTTATSVATWVIDDITIEETDVVGCPPHTWFCGKDLLSPSIKGLFDSSFNNIYTSYFHYTISNATSTGVYSYDITNPQTSGQILITSGTGSDYLQCKAVTVSGTDINWTNPSATSPYSKTYIDGDSAVLTYDTGTSYWLPLSYTYQIKIIKVGEDDSLSTYATYPVTTQVGSITIATSAYIQAYYYAALIANPISAPTTDYYLDTDLMFLSTGLVKVYGTVYDSSTGATIGSQVVGIYQSGSWHNATSDGSGYYEKNSFQAGLPISFTVIRAGYQTATFSFTPIKGGNYLCNMYLTPLPPAISDGSTTVFGYTLSTPYSQAVSGATVNIWNSTYLATTTATSGGYYEFTHLYNNTVYNINATAIGFGSNTSTVTTGAANSTTYKALWLTGGFDVTVQVRDASSNALITDSVEVTLQTIATQTTTSGSTTFSSVAYGTYGLTAACTGYTSESSSVIVTGDTTVTLYLDPIAVPTYPTPIPNPNQTPAQGSGIGYPPHHVRFMVMDNFGRPIVNAMMTATPIESTTPWSWLYSWMGINSSVSIQTQTLTGLTAADGSWDTMMVPSVHYNLQVVNASQGINHAIDLYPQEENYKIRINVVQRLNVSTYPNWTVTATSVNDTAVNLSMSFYDPGAKTVALEFWVMNGNSVKVYNKTWSSMAAGYTNWSYTVTNTANTMYFWGFNATNSDWGSIKAARGITLQGSGAPMVDWGLEDRNWYMWFGIAILLLIAGIFHAKSIGPGVIVTPLWGGLLFTYIRWFPVYLGAGCIMAFCLGVLIYMRKKEYTLRV